MSQPKNFKQHLFQTQIMNAYIRTELFVIYKKCNTSVEDKSTDYERPMRNCPNEIQVSTEACNLFLWCEGPTVHDGGKDIQIYLINN